MSNKLVETYVSRAVANLKHEVFNPKSAHYLDFNHFMDSEDAPGGLYTYTEVTHAFRITKNNAIYLPHELRESVPTLTSPYNVPVKGRHTDNMGNRDLPEIGRVIEGEYVDEWQGFANKSSIRIDDAISRSATEKAGIAVINDAMKKGLLKDKRFRGLGYIAVASLITDPEEVQKILDGRALTVSVEMEPEVMINNITGNSWIEDLDSGKVNYMPGDMVGGIKALKVPSNLSHLGYAFTSIPADPFARVINKSALSIDQLKEYRDRITTKTFVVDGYKQDANNLKQIRDNINHTKDGDDMTREELVKKFAEHALANTSMEDSLVEELWVAIKGEAPASTIASLKIAGVPFTNQEVVDALKDVEMSEENKLKLSLILDTTAPEPKADPPKTEEAPVLDSATVLAWLAENKEVAAQFVSDNKLKTEDEVKAIVNDSVKVQKSVLMDMMRENQTLNAAMEANIADSRKALKQAVEVIEKLSAKEPQEITDMAFSELKSLLDSKVSAINIDELRAKTFAMIKTPETNDVGNSQPINDAAPAPTKKERKAELVMVANMYANKIEDNVAKGKLYLNRLKANGVVPVDFDPISYMKD